MIGEKTGIVLGEIRKKIVSVEEKTYLVKKNT